MKETSIEAYHKSKPKAMADRKAIYNVLLDKKSGTGRQLAKWTGLNYHAVMRRMSELVTDDLVNGDSRIVCPINKSKVTLWELKEVKN